MSFCKLLELFGLRVGATQLPATNLESSRVASGLNLVAWLSGPHRRQLHAQISL